VTQPKRIDAVLVLIVMLIPGLVVMAGIPAYREVRLLTVSGTLTEREPVNYAHSKEFLAKGSHLRIVLRLWANQQIVGTIEVARIMGYFVKQSSRVGASEVRIFGAYPEKVMNRTLWDFHREYSKTIYIPLSVMPAYFRGKAPLGLEIEIFLEAPNFSSNPTFLVFWEITVYDVY